MEFPEQIESERLILKRPYPTTFDLAAQIYEAVDKSRETLRVWLPWVDKTHSAEDEYAHFLINWCQKHWEDGYGYAFLIYEKETHNLIGTVDIFKVVSKDKSGEIGYWLADNAVGNGYMQEAVKALQKTCFNLGFNRIVIENDTTNNRSVNVPKRLGYHLDGVMRQDCWDEYHQRFRDTNVWSLLKSEWAEKYGK